MPKVVDIFPKDVHITVEFGLTEVVLIKDALDNCELRLNLEDEHDRKVHEYIHERFYPFLKELLREADGS